MSGETWRPWSSLADKEQQQITWVIESLLTYAVGRLIGQRLPGMKGKNYKREFVADGLNVYLYAFYAKNLTSGILPVLRTLECSDLVARIEPLLTAPAGVTTFIEALSLLRARMITHPMFDYDHFEEQLAAKDLISADSRKQCYVTLQQTQNLTDALLPELLRRYPEAI